MTIFLQTVSCSESANVIQLKIAGKNLALTEFTSVSALSHSIAKTLLTLSSLNILLLTGNSLSERLTVVTNTLANLFNGPSKLLLVSSVSNIGLFKNLGKIISLIENTISLFLRSFPKSLVILQRSFISVMKSIVKTFSTVSQSSNTFIAFGRIGNLFVSSLTKVSLIRQGALSIFFIVEPAIVSLGRNTGKLLTNLEITSVLLNITKSLSHILFSSTQDIISLFKNITKNIVSSEPSVITLSTLQSILRNLNVTAASLLNVITAAHRTILQLINYISTTPISFGKTVNKNLIYTELQTVSLKFGRALSKTINLVTNSSIALYKGVSTKLNSLLQVTISPIINLIRTWF